MEFEVVSEKVEWEARRVAAAFGVKEWWPMEPTYFFCRYEGRLHQSEEVWRWVTWGLDPYDGSLFRVEVSEYGGGCQVFDDNKHRLLDEDPSALSDRGVVWMLDVHPDYHDSMARGLYRFGFEDEAILTELNHPLTAHEKLELRLSMPREFWPQKWIAEGEV